MIIFLQLAYSLQAWHELIQLFINLLILTLACAYFCSRGWPQLCN